MEAYKELKKQFEQLSEEEKRVLFIYKSKLGLFINSIDNDIDDDFKLKKMYENYKETFENPKNLFMGMTVFKDVSFSDFDSFLRSMLIIKSKVEEVCSKIIIPEDMTVYRAVSIEKDNDIALVSKSSLISTSININECLKFFITHKSYKHYLYQINLEKGSSVGICPYAILTNSKTEQVTLTKQMDQEELIINKRLFEFNEIITTNTKLSNGEDLNIVILDAKKKKKENKSYK